MKSGLLVIGTACMALICVSVPLRAQAPASPVVPPAQPVPSPDSKRALPVPTARRPGQTPDPSLDRPRSEKAAADAEPAENEEYTLGAGDSITLDFPRPASSPNR